MTVSWFQIRATAAIPWLEAQANGDGGYGALGVSTAWETALAYRILGIKVEDLTGKRRKRYRIIAREGVMIADLKEGSQLAGIGARPGDVIRQIDDFTIQNSEDFKKAIVKFRRKHSMVLLLQRGDQGYYITVNLS